MKDVIRRVKEWYLDNQLFTKSNPVMQASKLIEEAKELLNAAEDYQCLRDTDFKIEAEKLKALKYEIGDVTIVCIGICHMIGATQEECAAMSLDKIEARKVKWVAGELTKDDDCLYPL